MKYLALDLGTKTLGLAISDQEGLISLPYKTIHYNNYENLIDELTQIIEKEKIEEMVIGFPKNMNNTIGERANQVLEFKKILDNKFSLTIHLFDERLSTMEAEKYLIQANMRRNKRKKVIDNIAASIILDSFLRRNKNGR